MTRAGPILVASRTPKKTGALATRGRERRDCAPSACGDPRARAARRGLRDAVAPARRGGIFGEMPWRWLDAIFLSS